MIGRKKELQQLQEAYEDSASRLIVLSGRRGVGKTTLLQEFSKDKQVFYYQAAECSEKQQLVLLRQAWEQLYGLSENPSFGESLSGIAQTQKRQRENGYLGLFLRACESVEGKKVIILEDFLRIAKNEEKIYQDILDLLSQKKSVMIIITADTVVWREEEAEIKLRSFVGQITDRIYLESFQFLELVQYFPDLSIGDIIQIYALLGGVPGYLKHWDCDKTVEQNIIRLFLEPDAILGQEAVHYMKTTLRELSLYNTVLCAMTGGVTRLNDMYAATGFSRAKISVYMKNLKQLGVVSKGKTLSLKCHDQEIKGMYEITDPLVHFWYRFIYPRQSLWQTLSAEEFYQKVIREDLENYTAIYFDRVCIQYLELMNRYKRLPVHYEKAGSWYGKEGWIPLLAKDGEGRVLTMYTKWRDEPFTSQDLEEILHYLMKAGINPDCYYLFSKSDFEESLRGKADFVKNIHLVDLKDL